MFREQGTAAAAGEHHNLKGIFLHFPLPSSCELKRICSTTVIMKEGEMEGK
jgi:hypothetical protein